MPIFIPDGKSVRPMTEEEFLSWRAKLAASMTQAANMVEVMTISEASASNMTGDLLVLWTATHNVITKRKGM